jgi:hypothetical protein
VEDLAIGVDGDGAGPFEDALDVGAGDLAAGAISLPIVVVTTFLLNRNWVFREHIREGATV